jgi:phage shock protein C
MTYSRLYRSTTSRVFGGVAGGIAEYFNMDPVIIRIIFVLAAIFGGGGVIIYLVLWIAVPERPYTSTMFNTGGSSGSDPASDSANEASGYTAPNPEADIAARKYTGSMIGGIILIGIGALILATRVIPNLFFSDLWPFVLVVAGIILIVTSMNQTNRKDQP